jgi:GNAT superfamily N-acetyltransferase
MPSEAEVRELYRAASAGPPLHEPARVADLFARLYVMAASTEHLRVVIATKDRRLLALAYGHRWRWDEQLDDWSTEFRGRLGPAAVTLDDTYVLSLLARHPEAAGTGLGAEVLETWLAGLEREAVWLQTTDMPTPALRRYERVGFAPIGHGPDAPDGRPGLILLRRTVSASAVRDPGSAW